MFDTWQELALSGGVLVIVLLIVVLFLRWYFSRGGGLEGKGFRAGMSNRRKKESSIPPHATCPHAKDILSVVARTSELVEYRNQAKYELVEAQMRYWEEAQLNLEGVALKNLASELGDRGHKEPARHPDYVAYRSAIRAAAVELKDHYRMAMRRNHLAEMPAERWAEFKESKKASFLQIITDELNMLYMGTDVTRSELYKINMGPNSLPKFMATIDDCLEYARGEAMRVIREIEQRTRDHEDWLKKSITG